MAGKKTANASLPVFDIQSRYDRDAYEALTEVSWTMFRLPQIHTRTYPFIGALCVLILASLIAYHSRYSMPVIAVHIICFAFFALAMPLSNVNGKHRLCKKAIEQASKENTFPFDVRFVFSDSSIRAHIPGSQVNGISYNKITDLISYGAWRFLFFGQAAYMIRQDSFESSQELERFERFVSEKTHLPFQLMPAKKKFRA